jgi:formylglycine-generating enzyme required for sulfatase activity
MLKKLLIVFFFLLAAISFSQQNPTPQKYALVIGNSDYRGISKLTNPVNDANDMAAVLQSLGFTVDKVLNGNLEQMEAAVINFGRRLGASRDSYGFFFYAGHGVQADGENYLIPVTADNIQNTTQLRLRTVSLQSVMESLTGAGNQLNMIVLDACRDNPFGWNRSGTRGLSVVTRPPTGSIVMYATSANSTAADGTGRNGLFTSHLLGNLKTAGLSVYEVFDKTMGDVSKATSGRQEPELSLRFSGAHTIFLGTRPLAVQPTTTPAPVVTTATTSTQSNISDNMVRINGGTFQMGSPRSETGRDTDERQHQVTVSSFYMGKYEVTQKEYQEIMGTNPSIFKGDNLPVERVSWYDALVFCNKLSMKKGLSPTYSINGSIDPSVWGIVRASGDARWDAVVIVAGSNGYRLPTEAQWEYACRAGTTTPFNTGNNITTNEANYNGNNPYKKNAKGAYRERTTIVGSFAPNAWGLYDMHGNVWEWCWDWDGTYASGAQTNPQGASTGSNRIIRGGSWGSSAQVLRSAFRNAPYPSARDNQVGFRLVRP